MGVERLEAEGGRVLVDKDDFLDDVRWALSELQRIEQDMLDEAGQLEDFITGKRVSAVPLGAKFLNHLGNEVDRFRAALAFRLTGMMP